MTTVLEQMRYELSRAVLAPVYTDTEPYRPLTVKLSMLTVEHGEALLAVAEAAAEWLAAIERFRDPYVRIGDTRALATAAENKMRAAIAPLLEEAD